MQASVAIIHNPFQPSLHRENYPVYEDISIREWLDNQGITEFDIPTICLINNKPVLRKDWNNTFITEETVVTFIAIPQGGGGGGKNPLRTVLLIAVMIAAPHIGAALASSIGVTSTVGTALLTATVAIAGTALVNVLVPPPRPNMPTIGNMGGSNPSPTYSLQAQGNSARLGEPIPSIYGRHVIYPDFGATPYTEYVGNEQFLYQLHVIGHGEYDIEQVRIEDTPISSFEEITSEIIPPNGAVTLFDTDVVTAPEVAGQELLSTADGGGYVGPFIANPAETTASTIAIDVVMPRGLFFTETDGSLSNKTITWKVEARTIDDAGTAISGFVALATESHTASDNTPQRLTFKYPVTAARYEVQILRTDTKDTSARAAHEIRWDGLRSHLAGTFTADNVTLLALKMRATDNLSQSSSRMINCIVQRKLPIWDAVNGFSAPQTTRSIVWTMVDVLRAEYGAKLADSRIDLAGLVALDATFTSRGDYFDGVFDQKLTVWEALTKIGRCGRSVPYLQGGIVRVVRDESKTVPIALFSPRNIVKNSLKIQFVMPGEDTADAVTVEYFNGITWKNSETTVSLPGSSEDQPAKVALFGCTDKNQAIREGLYMAAANRYRRKMITFQTELEGLIPSYGDLIAINHDMPSWGQGGDVIGYTNPILKLSEPVNFTQGETHFIALRKRDGTVSGSWEVVAGASADEVSLVAGPLDFTPFTGTSEERTHFAFGLGEAWSVLARVLAVRPRGGLVEITCVGENDAVHTADQ